MVGCGREKTSGDWFFFYFPENKKITPEDVKMEKVEFEAPICCGKEMMVIPTDCGYACWVCDVCGKSEEVE